MAVWRLVRCNPWSYGGVDYVPEKVAKTKSHSIDESHVSGGVAQ
jgi:putative component of membrane protein insertase Oxa1/YidC/SpoIIIJ protein YidD